MDRLQEYKYLKAAGHLEENSSDMEVLAQEMEQFSQEMDEQDIQHDQGHVRIMSESNHGWIMSQGHRVNDVDINAESSPSFVPLGRLDP